MNNQRNELRGEAAPNREINSDELDKLLGKFFFGCNIPFVIVESEHFRNFVRALNPAYVPPTRKTLSTSILDKAYQDLQISIRNAATKDGILAIDGWKNSSKNTKNVVSMLYLQNGESIFLDSWNFSSLSETGENLSEVVNQSVNIANDKYGVDVYAVITDNASNMKSMGRQVDLWHVTCNSHNGNLLCKSLINSAFADRVQKIQKEFKSPALEAAIVSKGGNKVILAGDTRWCSHRDSFRNCSKNNPMMIDIINEGQHIIKEEIRNALLDQTFIWTLLDHILILDPVCELINLCQKNSSNISDAIECWLRLDVPAVNDDYRRLIDERVRKVINPIGLAANYLNPRYRGLRFSNNQQYLNSMNRYFQDNLSANGLNQLEEYRNGAGMFRALINNNYQSWKIFWEVASIFYQELSSLAIRLLHIPASTGELERLFSQWSYVHSPKRCKLTNERSAKLAALYYSYRLKDRILMDRMFEEF